MASVGQTRTHAKQATQRDWSTERCKSFQGLGKGARKARWEVALPGEKCQEIDTPNDLVLLDLGEGLALSMAAPRDTLTRHLGGRNIMGSLHRRLAMESRETLVDRFLHFACWDHHTHGKGDHRLHDHAAQRLLAQHPEIASDSLATAIVCGNLDAVRKLIGDRPESAREATGPRTWTPLLYCCYARLTHQPTIDNAVAIATLLLDAGANADDFYPAGDVPYTALVGTAGEGEQDSPIQPQGPALFALLLARGAKPFDQQVLYNTHFSGDMLWWLKLVYASTAATPQAAAWNDPAWAMWDMGGYGNGSRFILDVAIDKHNVALARWALEHGADADAPPARDRRFSKRTLYQDAVMTEQLEIAELLARHGSDVTPAVLTEAEAFAGAVLRLDATTARALANAHASLLQRTDAIFAAAQRNRADAVALLLDLGVPIEIADANNTRALHHAAANDAVDVAKLLIERGAEIDPRETNWNGSPIGWAAHGGKAAMIDLLSRHSCDVWNLTIGGYVERLRQVLAEDPARATEQRDGYTPLWWLPDDELKALELAELLIANGADPASTRSDGGTAADWARERGMLDVAARLDRRS